MKKKQPEHFKWLDSHSPRGGNVWFDPSELDHYVDDVDTVGYVLKESKRSVTVASQVSGSCVGGIITIPKCAIVKRRKLK